MKCIQKKSNKFLNENKSNNKQTQIMCIIIILKNLALIRCLKILLNYIVEHIL